ncbi:MAG: fibronectin type III domain-containing protein, partial [Ignavibacteriales bacterium]
MKKNQLLNLLVIVLLIITGCSSRIEKKEETKSTAEKKDIYGNVKEFITTARTTRTPIALPFGVKVDTIITDKDKKTLQIDFSDEFSQIAFREDNVKAIYDVVKAFAGDEYKDYSFTIRTQNKPIEELIPNFYRSSKGSYDKSRLALPTARPAPVVENVSKPFEALKGLYNKNIVLWQSHGWYYSNGAARWEWQRPRLFQSVEDKIPLSFTIPYIIPMLENAGANVFVPRERDIQTNEVIVDNDDAVKAGSKSYVENVKSKKTAWKSGTLPGFAYGNPPYAEGYNPFQHGTTRFVETDTVQTAEVSWTPNIPETGYYAVYITYQGSGDNASDALYTVYHAGGKTDFLINQKIGGSTWIYLGKFKFNAGSNADGKVVLVNKSKDRTGKYVSADAVRFGGGMGIVSRNGYTSGRPKYLEGSRYWLQFAGMPDTLVYNLNKNKNDYNDDYQSRGEYANYLKGAPFGPNRNRNEKGLGIPIDLSMAFHTDAGITHNDTTIGTLSIFSTENTESQVTFPDGVSRMASRDLADIVQTQIVDDIRAGFDPAWSRRQMKDAQYSEAYRPNMPSLLVELLSHQNLLDMKYMLDPRFRFTVARAMYKGMLKFLATQYNTDYVVQPLPVDHFQALLINGNAVLRWHPVFDAQEKTASPDRYVVYTRTGDGDFDNGRIADTSGIVFSDLKPGVIYSYKVTAVNGGGESFPSEILSVCRVDNGKKPVLVINGFDRICAPATVEAPGFSGFANFIDPGVPDKYDISFSGTQYDFNPASPFVSNDAPGHGASHADFETSIITGNTFDYAYVHGKSIKECGYSFSSASNESVWDNEVDLKQFNFVDLILGKEKETHWQKAIEDSLRGLQFKTFPAAFQQVITNYLQSGGNIFISGSYVASDLILNKA